MRRGGVALVLSLALAAIAVAQQGEAEFTAQERTRLIAGELVRRPAQRREGTVSYIGGTSFMRVDAPPERIWEEIVDAGNYTELIPGVEEARWVEGHGEGDRRVIYLRHAYAFVTIGYHANVRLDHDAYTIRFDLDRTRPRDIQDGRGYITIAPYRRGRESIVTWGVLADVGGGIVTGVFAPVIYDWILRVPYCIRNHMAGETAC
jgi:carbon monoxide dehydrogenase subunit G